MRHTISCAIVVFNEERNIREALDSVVSGPLRAVTKYGETSTCSKIGLSVRVISVY